ncbi:MAG TPA: mechanosensitive ion channel family protein [Candidatus Binatia bacterium]|jgi:small-conductance mechanosensitive channel
MHGHSRSLLVAVTLSAICALASVVTPSWSQEIEFARPKPTKDEPAPKLSTKTTPEQDQEIENRLRQIFSELEGAEGVQVNVRSGVVALTGEVVSQNAREQAVKLARQVEGVVEVKDKTTLVRDVKRQITPAIRRLREFISDFIGYLPLIAFAGVIFLGFWGLAFLLGKWDSLYRRFTRNQFLAHFLRQLVKLAVLCLGLLVAFELLDATALVGTVLGAAGLLGLALGFALRDTVENYIAGILLSMKQPFVHDDWVDITGYEGHVLRLTSRATILMTLDGNHVRIPNAKVFNGVVINYTRNPERRFHFDVGVSVDTHLEGAQNLAAKTLLDIEGVLKDPPPCVDVYALGDFNVTLRVFGWVDQGHFSFLKVKSEAIRLVKEAFDAAGIVMPEPIYNLRMQEPGAAARQPRQTAGSKKAIDIRRRTEIERQIAEDRRESGESDLLRPDAPLE